MRLFVAQVPALLYAASYKWNKKLAFVKQNIITIINILVKKISLKNYDRINSILYHSLHDRLLHMFLAAKIEWPSEGKREMYTTLVTTWTVGLAELPVLFLI